MNVRWDERYARRTARMTGSAIRELLKVTEHPEVISFAGGLPAPEVFPVQEVAEASDRILARAGAQALQYGATEGYTPLRELLAHTITSGGCPLTVDNVLITTGSQQALDLIGKIFLDENDAVAVESPTYLAALQAWNAYGARFLSVRADGEGMDPDHLETLLPERPKLVYCLPNFQNPRGVTLSDGRRRRLVDLSRAHGVPIVEDDPYRSLRFEGEHLPRLLELDSRGAPPYSGNVISLATFSKILSPGLRVGWVMAAPEVIAELTLAKQGTDLHSPTFNQMIAFELMRSGFLEEHLSVIVNTYRERRDVMLAALEEHFPAGARWTHPEGGMFLWVELPEGVNTVELLKEALEQRVAFVPGNCFHADRSGSSTMRLNFSNSTPDQIREGIGRLGRAVRRVMRETEPDALPSSHAAAAT
jgi:2-aminoadipate transaminase